MGPYYVTAIVSLLGPVRRVAGFASTFVRERTIEIGPRRGAVHSGDAHISSMLELASGATAMLVATFESPGHYSTMLVHGSDGEPPCPIRWVRRPDPDQASARRLGTGLVHLGAPPMPAGSACTTWSRRSQRAGAPHDGTAHSVVDVARSILEACDTGSATVIRSTAERPDAMPVDDVRRAGEVHCDAATGRDAEAGRLLEPDRRRIVVSRPERQRRARPVRGSPPSDRGARRRPPGAHDARGERRAALPPGADRAGRRLAR